MLSKALLPDTSTTVFVNNFYICLFAERKRKPGLIQHKTTDGGKMNRMSAVLQWRFVRGYGSLPHRKRTRR
ncbi:hypothetical protein B4144_2348 [Bacillus atrophaeus]|nr:hypothetical protein B4144_2348 [Bacillus atrophaeus]